MANTTLDEFNNIGIKITITNDGVEILSKILSDGCPVKFYQHYPIAINCPLHYAGGYNTCEQCWKKYLKKFVVKE